MKVTLSEVRYAVEDSEFVGGRKPYAHQRATLDAMREAMANGKTLCIVNTSVTGSGKTLANYACPIIDGVPAIGVYATKELIEDQASGLEIESSSERPVRVDSDQLDKLQDELEVRSHIEVLHYVTGRWMKKVILTNPDILHLIMFNAFGYGNKVMSYRDQVFQYVVNNYPILIFDEFHLYDAKQVGNVAFMVGAISRLAPNKPHVFVFSSATPTDALVYLKRLGIEVVDVSSVPSQEGRVVCEQIDLNLVPADLARWQGLEGMMAKLPEILDCADRTGARGVFILDSVYEARVLARYLAGIYGDEAVGEIHGYMDRRDRAGNLEKRFTVGTTTIDVGVDLTGAKAKDFIVFEARSAEQFIQRLGRLGRRGRAGLEIQPLNQAWAFVPHYVYNYLVTESETEVCQTLNGTIADRVRFLDMLRRAYTRKEDFRRYVGKYSPLEATAAARRILGQALSDRMDETEQALYGTIIDLFPPGVAAREDGDADHKVAAVRGLIAKQSSMWDEFGEVWGRVSSEGKEWKDSYLQEIESFRGGDYFDVAVYDESDKEKGLFPFKLYNLPFILRRADFEEMSEVTFEGEVRRQLGEDAGKWLRRMRRGNPLGVVRVLDMVSGPARKFWLEIARSSIVDCNEVLTKTSGFRIHSDSGVRLDKINKVLARRKLICWVSSLDPMVLAMNYNLPAMFRVYPLRPINPAGRSIIGEACWSVCFGREAFLISTVARKSTGSIMV